MENPLNHDNAGAPAATTPTSQAGATQPVPEADPRAPADPDDIAEQVTRFNELSSLLGKVDAHVSGNLQGVIDGSDDDTNAPETSDAAEHSVHVDLAYGLQAQAAEILDKPELTKADLQALETVIDDLDSRINEATPLSFDPNAASGDDLMH